METETTDHHHRFLRSSAWPLLATGISLIGLFLMIWSARGMSKATIIDSVRIMTIWLGITICCQILAIGANCRWFQSDFGPLKIAVMKWLPLLVIAVILIASHDMLRHYLVQWLGQPPQRFFSLRTRRGFDRDIWVTFLAGTLFWGLAKWTWQFDSMETGCYLLIGWIFPLLLIQTFAPLYG